MKLFDRKSQKGFSLVELLVVIVIIGILATVGIPGYRRMIAKSRKAEAKTLLGGIYLAESAFFNEYNTYGNALNKMGFQVDGSPQRYTVGFPEGGTCANPLAIGPAAGDPNNDPVDASFLAYYTDPEYVFLANGVTIADLCTQASLGAPDADGVIASFQATATGPISPGFTAASALTDQDTWTINELRQLNNTVDGVK